MAKLKILISGGGVAGNALAFWLTSAGHDVTIVERWDGLRSTGLQIDLRGHGIEVMRRMGLESAFRAACVKEEGLRFVDSSGRTRGYFAANTSGKGPQGFTSEFEIMRGDLVKLLYEPIKDKATFIFGTSVSSFEQTESKVEVTFADGRKDTFDLLVGAEGQNSRTRKMMLGPDQPDGIQFLNQTIAYFTTPRPMEVGEKYIATSYLAPGHRAVMTRRHNAEHTQVLLGCRTGSSALKDVTKGDVAREKEALHEVYRGAGWQTDKLLKAMDDSTDFYCERPGIVQLDAWSNGRVVLLGDAAYGPTANTGMGTTSSMVGAYILAGEIETACRGGSGDKGDILTALAAYDRKFRPFMAHVQHGVAEKDFLSRLPSSAFGIMIFHLVIGFMSFFKMDFMSRQNIKEEIEGWELPEYPSLATQKVEA